MIITKKKLTFFSDNHLHLLSILNNFGSESRFIGGCVRDALLNKQSADIDIATTLLPTQIIQALTEHKINFITIGIDFGTITAFIEKEQIEITTLRKDLSSNGRHPKVTYTKNFEEDAYRRDFTINALSYCPFKQEIYDYCNGMEDLAKANVVFIGDPVIRICEDYLRILRFFRFTGRFSKHFNPQGLKACIDLRQNLTQLSKERIKWEISKIIALDNFEFILEKMFADGILQIILPVSYFDTKPFETVHSFKRENNIQISSFTKYALIFYATETLSIEKLCSLKFSNKEAAAIFDIIEFAKNFDNADISFLLKKAWLEKPEYLDYIAVCIGIGKLDISTAIKFISEHQASARPKFQINGSDLINQGIQGVAIGKALTFLKNEWIKSDFTLSKSELLNMSQDENK